MKVLFAVNNEKISDAIIKMYQSMYKEIISWKNVYFFNAIIKELQRDKSYDRIVIGEDLEPYANNNYEVIDNFIFDKLDAISDEASNSREGDIPIILIATDRRERGESILVKLFGIGIYNVLLGQDRKVDKVCELIKQPRTKKEAKVYYKIESDDVEYQAVDPDSVSETEIQNIIKHYKKLGRDEDKYVDSFNDIAEQYTDAQLKLITKFLPLNVRAVLEERSPKYQQVMIGSVKEKIANNQAQQGKGFSTKNLDGGRTEKIDLIDRELRKSKLTKPVVIPSAINTQNVKKVYTTPVKEEPSTFEDNTAQNEEFNQHHETQRNEEPSFKLPEYEVPKYDIPEYDSSTVQTSENVENENMINRPDIATKLDDLENMGSQPVEKKKGRGRPRKQPEQDENEILEVETPKRGRGRPKKNVESEIQIGKNDATVNNVQSNTISSQDSSIDLFGLAEDEETSSNNTQAITNNESSAVLPGLDDFATETESKQSMPRIENDNNSYGPVENYQPAQNSYNQNNYEQQTESLYSSTSNYEQNPDNSYGSTNNYGQTSGSVYGQENLYNNQQSNQDIYPSQNYSNQNSNQLKEVYPEYDDSRLGMLLTGDKKIVSFVGTSKNGTSFLVNNVAAYLSNKGINTAILDLTQNKNSYYIYTANEDVLRNKAFRCMESLRMGSIEDGIRISKNLSVYTTLPGENQSIDDYGNILETLAKNHTVVLLDCDFETNINYFKESQEIYLVQTYDILTIQPLTAFLNELKYKNILDPNKLRIVINKKLPLRKLTDKMIVGGISCYNDPASTYINTLFNKDTIRFTTVPFEDATYARYLERLVDCEISLNGYSKMFLEALKKLADMVYPLIAGGKSKYNEAPNYNDYSKKNKPVNGAFNSNMNETLNKMRNNF